MKLREAINQMIMEERFIAEANNVTVDMFIGIPMKNKSEDLINAVDILTINMVRNDLINKVVNLTINIRNENNLIGCVANMTRNDVVNYINKADLSYLQFQFVDSPPGITRQSLLISRMIGIRHEEIPCVDSSDRIMYWQNQSNGIDHKY